MTVPAESVPFGALLTPMPLRTAGERVAERFVTAIALGEFVSGQRLPTERELAALLAVSRTTVREAIQRLQASGYVRTRRGRGGGTFVAADLGPDSDEMIRRTLVPAWQELTELLEFRQLIERMIARTAAERRDDSDVAAIRKAVEAYAKADSRDACRVADHALHRAIATATHNRHLVDLSTRIRGKSASASTRSHPRPRCTSAPSGSTRRSPRPSSRAAPTGRPACRRAFSLTEKMLRSCMPDPAEICTARAVTVPRCEAAGALPAPRPPAVRSWCEAGRCRRRPGHEIQHDLAQGKPDADRQSQQHRDQLPA
jgi:DNA-binding FadR family transcriptional regulator